MEFLPSFQLDFQNYQLKSLSEFLSLSMAFLVVFCVFFTSLLLILLDTMPCINSNEWLCCPFQCSLRRMGGPVWYIPTDANSFFLGLFDFYMKILNKLIKLWHFFCLIDNYNCSVHNILIMSIEPYIHISTFQTCK